MTYGSLFAGAGGADIGFDRAGLECVWQVEIDPTANDVRKRHWPKVKHYEDVRECGINNLARVDVICGGFPCQDLSVAGRRQGLSGERSGLWWEMLRIVTELMPPFVVWENVPGLISSGEGSDLTDILDSLVNLGYVVDINVLDARFFGVPQRRRRVFALCQHADHLAKSKTTSSVAIIANCLAMLSRLALAAHEDRFGNGPQNSASRNVSVDGIRRTMLSLNLPGNSVLYGKLLDSYDGGCRKFRSGQRNSGSRAGGKTAHPESTNAATQSTPCGESPRYSFINTSWKNVLAGVCESASAYTTSTETSPTTELRIFTFAEALLNTARLICRLSDSCPFCLNAASSVLTATKEFMSYARQAISGLFIDVGVRVKWSDFLRRADDLFRDARGRSGAERAAEILALTEGVSGHPPKGREAGEGIAASLTRGADGGGRGGYAGRRRGDDVSLVSHSVRTQDRRVGNGWNANMVPTNYVPETAAYLSTRNERIDAETETFVAHSLTAAGFDASEDGTGRGTPLVACTFPASEGGVSSGMHPVVPIDMRQASRGATMTNNRKAGSFGGAPGTGIGEDGDDSPTIAASHVPAIGGHGVRRLTPRECERLMSWPDDHTRYRADGREIADGPRYRLCGNGVVAIVAEWLARRIVDRGTK